MQHRNGNTDLDGQRLLKVLDEQHRLYAAMRTLGIRQRKAIDEEKTDDLLRVLAERQGVIDQISRNDGVLDPYREFWDDLAEDLGESEKGDIERRLEELGVLMREITESDERDRKTLELRRDSIASQASGVRRGGAALRAYSDGAKGRARFQDRRA